MATYKETVGTAVEQYAGNKPVVLEGELWYDSSAYAWKYQYVSTSTAAWASGGSLNTGRSQMGASGVQNAAIASGGHEGTTLTGSNTELYNGSSWTEVNNLNTGRRILAQAGAIDAALAFGGGPPNTGATESWNGSNWTEVNDLNSGRNFLAGTGTQTAALAIGGPSTTADTESWNGTNWTEVNNLNSGRQLYGEGAGTQTSSLVAGGGPPTGALTETFNGTNWTEVNDLNTARSHLGVTGADNTSAIAFGGEIAPPTAKTELWNGSNWTETADLSTARHYLGAAGTKTAGLAVGGDPNLTTSEEFTGAGLPISSWATSGNMNQVRGGNDNAGSGTVTATLTFAGNIPPHTAKTESYNGSNWTEVNDLNTARRSGAGAGTQTAALMFGGTPAPESAKTETWNGTNWTEVNDLNQGRRDLAGFGTNTSALGFGGYNPSPAYALTELWNGTNWTEVNDLGRPTGMLDLQGAGADSTAGLAFGGNPDYQAFTETWNGTNWTEANDLNVGRYSGAGSGTSTDALFSGGYSGPNAMPSGEYVALTESWNGTNWTSKAEMNTARRQMGSSGAATAGVVINGGVTSPGPVANTEEFTFKQTVVKTLE